MLMSAPTRAEQDDPLRREFRAQWSPLRASDPHRPDRLAVGRHPESTAASRREDLREACCCGASSSSSSVCGCPEGEVAFFRNVLAIFRFWRGDARSQRPARRKRTPASAPDLFFGAPASSAKAALESVSASARSDAARRWWIEITLVFPWFQRCRRWLLFLRRSRRSSRAPRHISCKTRRRARSTFGISHIRDAALWASVEAARFSSSVVPARSKRD